MAIEAPKIDRRSISDILKQILGDAETKGLRDFYTPEWTSTSSDDPGVVMANLFARLMEIIIERLNSVPDKNFLTFLDLAGIDRLPGNPARVPIQFTLAQGNTSGGDIPVGTQIATTQTETGDSYIFETEKSFFLSPVKLEKIFDLFTKDDLYSDLSALIDAKSSTKFIVFTSKSKSDFEHILFIGHDTLLGHKIPVDITLNIKTIENVHIPNWTVEWSGFKDGDWKPLTIEDTTDDLRSAKAGELVKIKNITNLEKTKIKDIKSYWIRAKLTTSITPGIKLPTIESLTIEVVSSEEATPAPQRLLDQAFFNTISIDVQKDFFPFGETPRFNDTFYFANEEVFSQKNQMITIKIKLSDALAIPSPDPNTSKIKLRWEYWNQEVGKLGMWEFLGESSDTSTTPSPDNPFNFVDNTMAFTAFTSTSDVLTIEFNCPDTIARTEINGIENYWIRVRIVEGDYGKPVQYVMRIDPTIVDPVPDPINNPIYDFDPETFKPPSIEKFELSYEIDQPEVNMQHCLTYNQFNYFNHIENNELKTPFFPFEGLEDTEPALYLGFDKDFGDVPISIYFAIKEKVVPKQLRAGTIELVPSKTTNSDTPIVAWEYFNGAAWARLNVLDGTTNLATRGTITFVGPSNLAANVKFGLNKYWIRGRLELGDYEQPPEIEGIYFNTVWAKNLVTQKGELIGSSNGQPNQNFILSQKPVLEGEQIYIRELEPPPIDEKQVLEIFFGGSAVVQKTNAATGEKEFWVRWIKVDNFYSSDLKSRHYTLDRINGEIKFSDGKQGMIPPLGTNNIKAIIYQSGGGVAANKFATSSQVKELKSSIPYVDKATNVANAAGGSNPESMTNVRLRGPQAIKHRNRAITAQDFVWLTKQASTQVALVKCLPTTNKNLQFKASAVTMIIVPKSDVPKPLPSHQLINHIKTYLSARTEATVSKNINVIGPHYLRIDVTAIVTPQKPEESKTVEQAISKNLSTYLHPLKGGPESEGWQFGRDIYISELYEVIEGIVGVEHVDSLRIQSSFWEKVLVFADPSERFDIEIPAGAFVSSIDGNIKLFLAEPISARLSVISIIIRGFQIGDKVKLKKKDSTESQELEIIRIFKDTLYFNTFKLSNSFNEADFVIAVNNNIQVLLAEEISANININSIKIKTFDATGFSVEIKPHHTTVSETKIISRVEDDLRMIPVNNYSLVYSGVHDIQMI